MARGCMIGALLLLCLLSACGEKPFAPDASRSTADASASAEGQAPAPTTRQDSWEDIERVADMGLAGFPAVSLSAGGDTVRESYLLAPEGQPALEVTVLQGSAQGACVYVVAGVHGDEVAGWLAAQLLKQAQLTAGTLYILSPANGYGAAQLQRKTQGGWDLNRAFPGGDGNEDAQRIAGAIFSEIAQSKPRLVLDLHEAQPRQGQQDNLGSSLICHSLEDTGERVLELLTRTQAGELCSAPFTLFGSPPEGSLNRVVTEELDIPVITVETDRSKALEVRVADQLAVVCFLLQGYGLC